MAEPSVGDGAGRPLRIGIVCPYSFDVAGGVQFHVRDLAESLTALGHHVQVLAPAEDDVEVPPGFTSAGRAVPVPYNGSVARLTFGPVTAARVSAWLDQGRFDVVHIHEPIAPGASILALWAARGPIVATFHTALERSRALQAAYPMVRTSMEKISAKIAVSADARETVLGHGGGSAVIIPNGVFVQRFAAAAFDERFAGTPQAPTLAFLGRIDEARKGLGVLSAALPRISAAHPGVRVFVAGHGNRDAARAQLDPSVRDRVTFLGAISDEEKGALLRSCTAYIAPHTGGESFGIVLVEALAAGAPVVAADLTAFVNVLGGGSARDGARPALTGELFRTGDSAALAEAVNRLLADPVRQADLRRVGPVRAARYDWSVVTRQVTGVYETVLAAGAAVGEGGVTRDDHKPIRRMLRTLNRERRSGFPESWGRR